MREVVFDTETTGLEPAGGHRIVQIGALELVNCIPTGRTWMTLLDPGRPVEPDAAAIHGITDDMLRGRPGFADIVEEFFDFIGEAPLVAHNAEFDRGFLNAELALCGREALSRERFIDTLAMARRRFPGQRASLDALCRQFGIDATGREQHDALLDCRLLAQVYLELRGGRQQGLGLLAAGTAAATATAATGNVDKRPVRPPRPHAPSDAELAAHEAFLKSLQDPLWNRS